MGIHEHHVTGRLTSELVSYVSYLQLLCCWAANSNVRQKPRQPSGATANKAQGGSRPGPSIPYSTQSRTNSFLANAADID